MLSLGRRNLLAGAAAAALLAACGGGSGGGAITEDDVVLGAADAPVTLIEYASVTCPHCATFHGEVWERLKENYIDTGRLRVVFREFPTPPAAVAVAGFQLARCGGASPEQYFVRVGELFRQQTSILSSGSMEGVRQRFIDIGAAAGLSQEQVMTCMTDQAGADRSRRIVDAGNREFNITGTPTLVLNGRKLESPDALTYDGLVRLIEAELAG